MKTVLLSAACLALCLSACVAQELLIAEETYNAPPYQGQITSFDSKTLAQSPLVPLYNFPGSVAIDPAAGKVFWIEGMCEIRGADLNGNGAYTVAAVPLMFWMFPTNGLAVDKGSSQLYWTDMMGVYSISEQGGGYNQVVFPQPGIVFNGGLALDIGANKMYFSGIPQGQGVDPIYSTDLAGNNFQIVFDHPTMLIGVLALDSAGGRIYFTDDNTWSLWSVTLQGADLRLHSYRNDWVRAIAVDETEQKLYWAENSYGTIRRSDLNGGNVETVFHSLGTLAGMALLPPPPPPSTPSVNCGDCVADGQGPNVIDALAAARLGASMNVNGISLANCDVDGNGQVGIMDALRIAQTSAQLRATPCDE